jgi:hypothetical protein
MTPQETQALDLMIEDLHIKHMDIRNQAKELGCESELEDLKNDLIGYLYERRKGI